MENKSGAGAEPGDPSLFLAETSEEWLPNYAPGKLKAKRLKLFVDMHGAVTL